MPLGEVYPTYEEAMAYLNDPRMPPEAIGVTRGVEPVPGGFQIVAYDQSGDRTNTPSEYAGMMSAVADSFTGDPNTDFQSYGEALEFYPDGVFEDKFVQRTTENAEERGFLKDLAEFMRKKGYFDYGLQETGGGYDEGIQSRQQSFDAVHGAREPMQDDFRNSPAWKEAGEMPTETSWIERDGKGGWKAVGGDAMGNPVTTTEDAFMSAIQRMKPSQARAYAEDLLSKGMVPQGPRAQRAMKMLGLASDSRPSDADRDFAQESAGGDAMGNPASDIDAPVPQGMTIREVLERYGG